jgi:hypothetical protein
MEKGGSMKSVLVVKIAAGYVVVPHDESAIFGKELAQGRAVDKGGYDYSALGRAVNDVFTEIEEEQMPTPAPEKKAKGDTDVPF